MATDLALAVSIAALFAVSAFMCREIGANRRDLERMCAEIDRLEQALEAPDTEPEAKESETWRETTL